MFSSKNIKFFKLNGSIFCSNRLVLEERKPMEFAISLVIIIVIASLLGTMLVARNAEHHYGQSTKQNVTNLSAIYIVLVLSLLIGVTWYAVTVL